MAALVGVLEVKFTDEFFYAHIMMLRHALENAGNSFHFNWYGASGLLRDVPR